MFDRMKGGLRPGRSARLLLGLSCALAAAPAGAGTIDVFGLTSLDYKLTLGYALSVRMEESDPLLIDGPIDIQQVQLNLVNGTIGSFGHTGLPDTTNYDDGNRDFRKGSLLNNRVSAYLEVQLPLEFMGLGDVGGVASAAGHYDDVFYGTNDHDNVDSVNRMYLNANNEREGPINEWRQEAVDTTGQRYRWLESYLYGQWYLTDSIGLALRAGRHLAAWGESLFFPGIVSAQGPFDATKANVPGVEVKEILLPVNQVSMQLALTDTLTVLAYNQFEFKPTEIFPAGDFFSPADLVGPGGDFGYGSINPISQRWCSMDDPGPGRRLIVTDSNTGNEAPNDSLCIAAAAFENAPEYVMIYREPDKLPGTGDQFGGGVKYQLFPDLNVGAYYLHYNNHNPHVLLNMGAARIGDTAGSCGGTPGSPSCQPVTTADLGITIPYSYTVAYADDVEMTALSFSTVFWVFNVAGEVYQRRNIDISLEADILGAISPVNTRGKTTTAQASLLYVNNPGFIYDEVVVVAEFGYTQVEETAPLQNQPGICMSGTDPADCDGDTNTGSDNVDFNESGNTLFYSDKSYAMQMLVLPKVRNAFAGWDLATPLNFSWLIEGTPSTPGVFGAVYGEGDMRIGPGITLQYLQNLEFAVSYNMFLGDASKRIGNSPLHANPYVDHDYLALSIKYNL